MAQKSYNNNNDISMNTTSLQFYSKNVTTTLVTAFWNNRIVLKIHPALDNSKQSESARYDYDNYVRSTVSSADINTLLMALNKYDVVNKVRNNDYKGIIKPVGLPVGSGFLEIGTGYHYGISEPNCICIRIYDGINEKYQTDTFLTYVFEKSKFYTGYNNTNGTFEDEYVDSSFDEFISLLVSFVRSNNRAVAHSLRETDRWMREKDKNNMIKIMEKLGLPTDSAGARRSYQNNSGFANNGNNRNNDRPSTNSTVEPERLEIDDDDMDLPF